MTATGTKANNNGFSAFDAVLWLVAIILIAGGVAANFYFSDQALALRLAGWLVLSLVTLGIVSQTAQGQLALGFVKEARSELRKVVWPSRQQTVQTTLIVIAMVVVMSLLLWGADSIIMWLVGLVTGQKG